MLHSVMQILLSHHGLIVIVHLGNVSLYILIIQIFSSTEAPNTLVATVTAKFSCRLRTAFLSCRTAVVAG